MGKDPAAWQTKFLDELLKCPDPLREREYFMFNYPRRAFLVPRKYGVTIAGA